MSLGLTADQVMAGTAVLGGLGTITFTLGGYVLHQHDKEMSRLDSSIKKNWESVDRLKDERLNYATRADNEKLRAELKADLENLGKRLEAAIENVSSRFHDEVSRILEAGDK